MFQNRRVMFDSNFRGGIPLRSFLMQISKIHKLHMIKFTKIRRNTTNIELIVSLAHLAIVDSAFISKTKVTFQVELKLFMLSNNNSI